MNMGTGEVVAPIGHNRPPLSKEELERAFRERTRADRITESTPFDLKWQWEVWLSDLPSSAMLVAFAIRIYANQDGTKSHPSLDTLAMMTKLSRRHVQDSLKLIEKTLVRKTAGAGRAPNRYTLIIPGETLKELATVIDMHSRAPRASQGDGSRAPGASLADSVAGHPVPHKPVVGQMGDRSRAPGAPDITRDITTTLEGAREERPFMKAMANVALGLATATATALPTAAAPTEPPAIIQPAKLSHTEMVDRMFDAAGLCLKSPAVRTNLLLAPELRSWLLSGCDFDQDIIPVIRAVSSGMAPASVSTWGYFTGPVSDHRAKRTAPMPEGRAPPGKPQQRLAPWEEKELRVYNETQEAVARLKAKYKLESEQGNG